jgi:hypothetical protein
MSIQTDDHRIQTEDHRVPISSPYPFCDSLTHLWKRLIRQYSFLRLHFPSDPTEEEIDSAIERHFTVYSPRSATLFDTYDVIYRENGTVLLVTRNPTLYPHGRFVAVKDNVQPNRYFIAYLFSLTRSTEGMMGLFVYVDDSGNVEEENKVVCPHLLATYDRSHGSPLLPATSLFLYRQTLLFTQLHRVTRRLILHLYVITYENDTITDKGRYETEDVIPRFSMNFLPLGRFLYYATQGQSVFFDMGGVNIPERIPHGMIPTDGVPNRETHIHYRTYRVPADKISGFLEMSAQFPETEYGDGYPVACILCGERTASAIYHERVLLEAMQETQETQETQESHRYLIIGLGNSYCTVCHIRYSRSKKEWICTRLQDRGMCERHVAKEHPCQADHSTTDEYAMMTASASLKYPYRSRIHLQRMAVSEE